MLRINYSDDKEIIALSSQTSGETAIILNTWMSEEESHSFNLPFTPPSIVETLNESQMEGICLDPYLRSRFDLCNAGSALITNVKGGGVSFFVQNSIGTIYITYEIISPYLINMSQRTLSKNKKYIFFLSFRRYILSVYNAREHIGQVFSDK